MNEVTNSRFCKVCEQTNVSPLIPLSCGHAFCFLCHVYHLICDLKSSAMGISQVRCMGLEEGTTLSCKCIYTHTEILNFLTRATGPSINSTLKSYLQHYNTRQGKFVRCPKGTCDGGAWIEKSNNSKEVVCLRCNLVFCKICGDNPHYLNCKFCKKCCSIHTVMKNCLCIKCGLASKCNCAIRYGPNTFRPCPSCKLLIQNSTDCPAMECCLCSYKFCFKCGESYSYDHEKEFHYNNDTHVVSKTHTFFLHNKPKMIQLSGTLIDPCPIVYISKRLISTNGLKIEYSFQVCNGEEGLDRMRYNYESKSEFVKVSVRGIVVPYVPNITTTRLCVRIGEMVTYSETFFVISNNWMASGTNPNDSVSMEMLETMHVE